MSSKRVIETARADLGYTEDPPGSNRTKFGAAYGLQHQPWCVMAMWVWFVEAGERNAFFGGAKTASCSILYRWYRENGQEIPVSDIQTGDLVFMNFHGTQALEHIGLVERKINDLGWYLTLEGNTSPGLEGSQDNGGCVAEKARHTKNIVKAVRPVYTEDKPNDYEGHWAEEDIRWAIERGILKGYEDGSIQPDKPVTRAELAAVIHRLEATRG